MTKIKKQHLKYNKIKAKLIIQIHILCESLETIHLQCVICMFYILII